MALRLVDTLDHKAINILHYLKRAGGGFINISMFDNPFTTEYEEKMPELEKLGLIKIYPGTRHKPWNTYEITPKGSEVLEMYEKLQNMSA